MKKFLTLILIAGLLTAALAVPASATSVGSGDCTMSYDCPHTGDQHMAGCPMIPCTADYNCAHGDLYHIATCPYACTSSYDCGASVHWADCPAVHIPPSVDPTVPTAVPDEEWMKDIWLYIYVNADIVQPAKRILLNDYAIVDDGELTMIEILSVVDDYYAATNMETGIAFRGAYVETSNITAMNFISGMDETPITGLNAARMDGTVVIKTRVTGVVDLPEEAPETPEMPAAYMNVSDVRGVPGDTVTVTLEIDDVAASSVGVKYTLPEGIEFVSGQWLLEDGIVDSVADFGAAIAWAETRAIAGNVLELTLQIHEGATMQGSIPFQVVLKDVDTTVGTASLSSTVQVDYYINIFGIDCSSINLGVGGSRNIGVQVDPEFLADQVVWTTSDPSVAEVSNGTVTGIGPGTAIITAQLGDWPQQCTVNVFESSDGGTKPCMITGEPGCVRHIRCIINSLLG